MRAASPAWIIPLMVQEREMELFRVPIYPRIVAVSVAVPPFEYAQDEIVRIVCAKTLGIRWHDAANTLAERKRIERLFAASGVKRRFSVVDLDAFYQGPRSTGERMSQYQNSAYHLGREALSSTLAMPATIDGQSITDFIVVSCTGYSAPGLDVQLARDLGMPRQVRRTVVGHMGCFGALVGLRQGLAAVRAYPDAIVAVLGVELSTLHFSPTLATDPLTSFSLFGDAAAAVILRHDTAAGGPELVDTFCAAEFESADQMAWTITDQGFVMRLSPRVPVALRNAVDDAVAHLLQPHGLTVRDITHWLIHPGGPSILEAIQRRLELSAEQMALSWRVLADFGNCSSVTVLLMLDALLVSGAPRQGEWGVMMAFGPGLTLETCLLRF